MNYREPHVFDPISSDADECECGLTQDAEIHESDEAHEERMRPRIVNAPERIWLQVGCDDELGEIQWNDLAHSEVSWCAERIDKTDLEYVSTDLLATRVKDAQREFINNIAAVLDADDVEAFTALIMKAIAFPDLNSETRSALKSEAEIRKEAREEAFRDAIAILERTPSTSPNWMSQSKIVANFRKQIKSLFEAASRGE